MTAEATAIGRLTAVRSLISRAEADGGRKTGSVRLVAVSKTVPAETIRPYLEAGQRIFGENRVQEAASKWPELRIGFPDLELHLIGSLQTNKAEQAVQLFNVIEVVDRPKLARALADAIARTGRRPRCLVQVNTGEEPQKGGVTPAELDALIAECRRLKLPLSGLMCIPPESDPPSPHFALLAKLARQHGLEEVSMGMSGDFPAAVQCGATHVRIGSAIFGAR